MTTIHEVAKRAGVSISTVSRVLNGTTYVKPDVEARVRTAMRDLKYQPSRAARSLRLNRSNILGLLITDIQNPFFLSLVRGVEDVAQRNGYSLLLCNSDEDLQKERQYVDILCTESVAGAIVVPTREHHQNIQPFYDRGIPIVAVDRRVKDNVTDVVLIDNVRGAYEAVAHLISNGYRRIGIITGPSDTTTGGERLHGYYRALQEAGLPPDPSLERYGSFKIDSGKHLAKELFSLPTPIDALFVANNLMTLGALEAVKESNIRIPEDIAIVSFDEMPWMDLSMFSLTTVTQPTYEIGNIAATRLLQRLQNPGAFTKQEFLLAPTLHVRASSAPRGEILPVEQSML